MGQPGSRLAHGRLGISGAFLPLILILFWRGPVELLDYTQLPMILPSPRPRALILLPLPPSSTYTVKEPEWSCSTRMTKPRRMLPNYAPLLTDTMEKSCLIVIGYSGLSDKVFDVLAGEYTGRQRLFWLGRPENPKPHIRSLIEANKNIADYFGKIDADRFLIDLARELGCFPPLLFENHYAHLLRELKPVVDFPVEGGEHDFFNELIVELETSKSDKECKADTAPDLRTLGLQGEWNKILELGEPDEEEDRRYYALALGALGVEIHEEAEEKLLNVQLFDAAIEYYQKALIILPDYWRVLYNWGNALSHLADLKNEPLLFEQTIEKFEQVLEFKPNDDKTFRSLGNALIGYWRLTSDKSILFKARKLLERSLKINPDDVYNLACLEAIEDNLDKCRTHLEHCAKMGTIPDRDHLVADADLEKVREEDWFKKLVEKPS